MFRSLVFALSILIAVTACKPGAPSAATESSSPPASPTAPSRPQVTADNYRRAERFLPANKDKYWRNGSVTPNWIGEEDRFWYKRLDENGEKEFVVVDAATGDKSPAFDHDAIAAELDTALTALKAQQAREKAEKDSASSEADASAEVDVETEAETLAEAADETETEALPFETFTFNEEGGIDLTVGENSFSCDSTQCVPKARDEEFFTPDMAVSPDGEWAVYFKDHNLWLRSKDGTSDSALTTDGVEDFEYAIEVGTTTAYISEKRSGKPLIPRGKWSPDSSRFLTMKIDQRQVKELAMIEFAPQDGSNRPITHSWRHALTNDEHKPMGTFVLFDAPSGKRTDINLPLVEVRARNLAGQDSNTVWWLEDEPTFIVFQFKPYARGYSFFEISADTGQVTTLVNRTTQRTSHPGPTLVTKPQAYRMADGDFIYWSDEDNWGHLYKRAADGSISRLTSGEWNVMAISRVDEDLGRIFYLRTRAESEGNPNEMVMYSMALDGSEQTLMTPGEGTHSNFFAALLGQGQNFSPSGHYFVDNYGSMTNPGSAELRSVEGNLITLLESADITALERDGFVPPKAFTATAADGKTTLYGTMFFPANFDAGKKYPVIDSVYPGPQIGRVFHDLQNATFALFDGGQKMAELGFIAVNIDGRGTPGRSRDFLYPPGDNVMATAGYLEDHIAVIRQLAAQHDFMDIDKVGIHGWSGGGYASTHAMFTYPDFFKVAVSGAGNHDQRTYIPDWGEYYVGPDNGENYVAASNAHLAKNLQGKLLLVHGALDDNVHVANTMQVVEALIRANKDFDLLILPNSNHGPTLDAPYYTRRKWDYFVENLLGAEPPKGYEVGKKD